jgi:hypothetical protein
VKEPTNILPELQLINLSTQKQLEDDSTSEPAVVRCSVIQRVPSVKFIVASLGNILIVQIMRKDDKPTAPSDCDASQATNCNASSHAAIVVACAIAGTRSSDRL